MTYSIWPYLVVTALHIIAVLILCANKNRKPLWWCIFVFFLPVIPVLILLFLPDKRMVQYTNEHGLKIGGNGYLTRENAYDKKLEYGQVRCSSCRTIYGATLTFMDEREVRVASCRVCPVNHIYAICANCADIDAVTQRSCPHCGARMWEKRGLVPK